MRNSARQASGKLHYDSLKLVDVSRLLGWRLFLRRDQLGFQDPPRIDTSDNSPYAGNGTRPTVKPEGDCWVLRGHRAALGVHADRGGQVSARPGCRRDRRRVRHRAGRRAPTCRRRSPRRDASTATDAPKPGRRCIGDLEVDVADRASVTAGFARVRAELGPVEILVTSAGIESFTPLLDITAEKWDRIVAVNLTGTFTCVQAAIPDMLAAGGAASSPSRRRARSRARRTWPTTPRRKAA